MEQEVNFKVKESDGIFNITQTAKKILSTAETTKELSGIEQEVVKLKQQKIQVEKAIEEKQIEKQLKDLSENLEKLEKLRDDINYSLQPHWDDLKVKMKVTIAIEKAKRGYKRIKDKNEKIVLQNNIIGPIANDFEIDMNHQIIRELKRDFDKI